MPSITIVFLSDQNLVNDIINRCVSLGYEILKRGENTILKKKI